MGACEADDAFSARADAVVAAIMPHLSGLDPELQGAVLADLVAIWLGGHRADEPDAADAFRRELLGLFATHVMELVEMYLEEAPL